MKTKVIKCNGKGLVVNPESACGSTGWPVQWFKLGWSWRGLARAMEFCTQAQGWVRQSARMRAHPGAPPSISEHALEQGGHF